MAKRTLLLAFSAMIVLIILGADLPIRAAALASAITAFLIIIDGILFEERIYHNAAEPTIMSGVMQGLPLLLVPFVAVSFSFPILTLVAFGAGMLYTYAFSLYFRSLELDRDMVVISVMWNIPIGLVPLLAFYVVDEDLSGLKYAGIALIFIGAMVASYQSSKAGRGVVSKMLVTVLLLALDEVALKWVYVGFRGAGLTDDSLVFWSGALPHAAGAMAIGFMFFRKLSKELEKMELFIPLVKRLWLILLFIEAGQSAADLLSNYATSIGDVSIVNAIWGTLGIFAAVISTLVALVLSKTRVMTVLVVRRRFRARRLHEIAKQLAVSAARMSDKQFEDFGPKLVGMALITIGAYLVA